MVENFSTVYIAPCFSENPAGFMENPFSIRVVGVAKRFGDVAAVDHVSLDIRRGEFFSLLGPSGCGKTTLLRMIAGLEEGDAGNIIIDGSDVTRVPAHRRPVNLVFQQFALFPHLNVEKNVAFGLRYKSGGKRDSHKKVSAALDLVRLSGLQHRYPDELSGGQKQRVALARALVLEPRVLLLDEPLGALDQKLRKEMQVELKHLQRRLGITFVFVTHDQEEALTMSDRIAVMNAGKVEQMDSAAEVFEHPSTPFVAEFMGAGNFFTAKVREVDGAIVTVISKAGFETALLAPNAPNYRPGEKVRFVVRPEKLEMSLTEPPPADARARMEVTVEERVYQGVATVWTVRNRAGERIHVYQQNVIHGAGEQFVDMGKAWLCWDPRNAILMREQKA
ncbi:MAG: Spermidine/putrescine import ATP-binding protein PotA [Phycisphaerales bacterium]|nr:Spermidine/putrescine import ATP-binding protein PotA [Phycisphaerales bacterium]